jgi:hypothetical protein
MKSLSVNQLSKLIGVPKSTMYTRMEAGRIPIGDAIRWLEQELYALYRDQSPAKRLRRYENALTSLRVERAMDRMKEADRRRNRSAGRRAAIARRAA